MPSLDDNPNDASERMSQSIGGGEDYSGVSFRDLLRGAASSLPLTSIARESLRLCDEWHKILWGLSDRELPTKDPRFADATWRENPAYRRLAQSYFAFCDAVNRLAEEKSDWQDRERSKFLAGILTSTLAPTNTVLGNPVALKSALETGGMSLVRGAQHLLSDLAEMRRLPRQVNGDSFKIGENLAATPGAVVFRNEMFELLHYKPTTSTVRELPTLMIVPPIGKYYFMDLAPKRSFTEFAVSRGIQFFTMSWRNPDRTHSHWGLDDYVRSCLEAISAVTEISGSQKLNTIGLCAGGIINSLTLNYMCASGDDRVNAATFGVTLLDFESEAPMGAFKTKPVLAAAKLNSSVQGILPAASLAQVFAWMRPNDLVWNYWVNNYLLGKDPPSFDILAWSVDGTNLPGALHTQFLNIFEKNALLSRGQLKVLDVPVDLKQISIETFVTGALTDHLTPWKGCYRTTQLFGGRSTYVLSNAGHIASLVNPPDNPKATYYLGPDPGPDPEEWLRAATKHTGTWWSVWADWIGKRSGKEKDAPTRLGSDRYPVLTAAPGTYVLQSP